jgi:two-component sensor histidine kinase
MSLPNIETVRAMSSFENALIYVIFKDNSDLYEARNRILEQLSQLAPTLPKEAKISIGPDATGIGWAYQYILKSDTKSLDELRTYQDYYLKYGLLGVDGVSEVAAVGGFVKNYEITLDQAKMVQYDISFEMVSKALKSNNNDTGGRIILDNGYEKIVESTGYLKNEKDIEIITLKTRNGIPLKLNDIASINIVPAPRRGMADFNGEGEVVGGIVVVRFQENPYEVIQRVKEKIKTLATADVELVPTYDRTELIDKAIDTLKNTLLEIYIESKNIRVQKEIKSLEIFIDLESATRLINNLISNALKYSKPNADIVIQIKNNTLIIQDKGIGIKKDKLNQVKQRFYRANESEGGFGIGLDIVDSICKRYNINFEIESIEGSGTKVTLRF